MIYAKYIDEIEIEKLWTDYQKHILWKLNPEVNILSGANGEGKSTILKRIVSGVKNIQEAAKQGVAIKTFPNNADLVRLDIVHTVESVIEYDKNLEARIKQFNNYDNLEQKKSVYDIIDNLFSTTEKIVDRKSSFFCLSQRGNLLDLKKLSNGEKQLLRILLTVTLQDKQPTVLCMDEPEMSLHFDWQKQLIGIIRKLNPNVQIILTTHSPAIVMNGWMDRVTDVSDIEIL